MRGEAGREGGGERGRAGGEGRKEGRRTSIQVLKHLPVGEHKALHFFYNRIATVVLDTG